MGSQPQYRSRSWEEIEKELSHDWGTRYQDRSWDMDRKAVHQGWTVARRSR